MSLLKAFNKTFLIFTYLYIYLLLIATKESPGIVQTREPQATAQCTYTRDILHFREFFLIFRGPSFAQCTYTREHAKAQLLGLLNSQILCLLASSRGVRTPGSPGVRTHGVSVRQVYVHLEIRMLLQFKVRFLRKYKRTNCVDMN